MKDTSIKIHNASSNRTRGESVFGEFYSQSAYIDMLVSKKVIRAKRKMVVALP